MNHESKQHRFKLVVLEGKNRAPSLETLYDRIYTFWKTFWLQTYRSVDGPKVLHSDHFIRQRVYSVFYDDKPVAFFLADQFDMNNLAHRDHSYFEAYPDSFFDKINRLQLTKVLTISYLSVDPNWRQLRDYPLADLLMSLAVKAFQSSEAQAMIGHSRNDRKTDELARRHGGESFGQGIAYGIPSDFFVFSPHTARFSPKPDVAKLVEELWTYQLSHLNPKKPSLPK